jgi:hypothetical protein
VVDPANLLALLSGNWPVSSSITGSFDAVGCYGLSYSRRTRLPRTRHRSLALAVASLLLIECSTLYLYGYVLVISNQLGFGRCSASSLGDVWWARS